MSNNLNNLEKAILKTIIYYDLFSYPLTAIEIWQKLFQEQTDLFSVVQALENSENLKKYTQTQKGFYFLLGKENLIQIRQQRRTYSIKKWKKALWAVKIIRFIPFIRGVFLCNSIPYFNASKDSDIDVLIIIKDKYIWFSRFWITALLHLFGLRRHGKKTQDRICLSFYISDKNLNLRKFYDQNNLYLYYWIRDLVPIFDNGIYKNFLEANTWIQNFLPNSEKFELIDNWLVKNQGFSKKFRLLGEFFLDNFFGQFLNYLLKKIQVFKMSFNKNSRMKEDNDSVVINDQMLKFHEAGLEKINKLLSRMNNF